jgi:hypothetical protein
MENLKIYLDSCCYNKPVDMQDEIISTEINPEDFNYTEWRSKQPWVNMPLDEAIANASAYVQNNPDALPFNATVI